MDEQISAEVIIIGAILFLIVSDFPVSISF